MHDLAAFCLHFPAWVGPDGMPLSWRHYVHGMQQIERSRSGEKLRIADAVSAHKQKQDDFKRWWREHVALSGYGA
jgi:hypothetical protein